MNLLNDSYALKTIGSAIFCLVFLYGIPFVFRRLGSYMGSLVISGQHVFQDAFEEQLRKEREYNEAKKLKKEQIKAMRSKSE